MGSEYAKQLSRTLTWYLADQGAEISIPVKFDI